MLVILIAAQPADQRLVKLDGIGREFFQISPVAVAGTKVINRYLYAKLTHALQLPDDFVRVGHEHTFGKLKFKAGGVQAVLLNFMNHRIDEFGVFKIADGNVHRNTQVHALRFPTNRLLDDCVEHPQSHGGYECGFFSQGDKFSRADGAQ